MVKRTLSFVLALAMVVGFVPVFNVQATQSNDVVYVDESTSISELVESGLVHMESPKGETSVETALPQPSLEPQQIVSPVATVCDCGRGNADIYSHSDNCALLHYYINVCGGDAAQIYELWRTADGTTRTFLEDYLKANAPEKWEEVAMLRDANASPDDSQKTDVPERLGGEASISTNGITLDAVGVPEGSSLTVKAPSVEAMDIVEQIVAAAEEEPEQVFVYDISVQNDQSKDWQPEGTSVELSLTIPGLKLHQYTEVRIIHVDDEGNDSLITGTVDENGVIVFETCGFSTFAGFTVDFTYGSAMVSIPGKTSTTMGTLFQKMKMPLDAADIVDVQFTDYSLLTVTQEENDWRLTSLVPFTSHETLTFTMEDGNVYEFMVTDAVAAAEEYADIKTGITGTVYQDDNGHARWFADADGTLITGRNPDYWQSAYWAENAIVYIMGKGVFSIAIQPHYALSKKATSCYVNMKQVRVQDGANVTFYIGSHFLNPGDDYADKTPWSSMKNVYLTATDTSQSLFHVESGTLSIEVRNENKFNLILRGGADANKPATWVQKPLITLETGTTRFEADGLVFENGPYGGVYSKGLDMSLFKMTNCTFKDTVTRISTVENGKTVMMNGGAIYLTTGTLGAERYVEKLEITNCTFNGNISGSYGGALYLSDYINEAYITGCTFTGCSSGASGGSISLRGTFGKMEISGCTFENSTAGKDGGAISSETLAVHESSGAGTKFNRIHTLNLIDNTFTNCRAVGTHDETYDGVGGAVNLAVQLNNLNIDKCYFIGCAAQGGTNVGADKTNLAGGGLALGYTNLGDNATDPYADPRLPWTDMVTWTENGVIKGNDFCAESQGWWLPVEGVYRQRTTFGTVNITNSEFRDTVDTYQGGAILVRTGATVEHINMTDSLIDNCEVEDKGSAVFFNNCVLGTVNFLRCTISNCRVTDTISQGGGTIRTVGQTSVVLTLEDCVFENNQANQAGGGLYWNAGQSRPTPGGQNLTTMATVKGCKFINNKATGDDTLGGITRRYGGGIFCETRMIIQGCIFDGNEAELGGGLCMGVYNASYRMFEDGEVTQLALDSKTEFYNNKAINGGGLAIRANKSEALLDTETLAHTVDFTLGGAKVYNNTATENGGGIYYIAETYAGDDLGNAEVSRYTKTINIDNGTVYGNTAGMNGGGIFMSSSNNTTITVSNGTIYGNSAGTISGGNGGGIYLTGTDATVLLTGGVIGARLQDGIQIATPNSAKMVGSVGGTGGGIAVFNGGRIEMSGGYVVYNKADLAGGGIAVHNNATMYITEGYVAYNEATYGGGISVNGALGNANSQDETKKYGMYFDGGHVNNNKVTPGADGRAYGGGICLSNYATMKIDDGEIINNFASSTLNGDTFAEGQEGGGIAACDMSELIIAGGVIDGNKAYDGGGIVIRGASDVNMYGSVTVDENGNVTEADGVIKNNWAQRYGGGIDLINAKSIIIINNGYIVNNEAGVSGGGVFAGENSAVELNNGRIESNESAEGGGVYIYCGSAKITGGSIMNNSATDSGGGVGLYYAKLTVEGGTFSGNSAQTFGGAIAANGYRLDETYTYPLMIDITGGTFENNTAVSTGGALYAEKGFVTVSGGSFIGNESETSNGGGIYLTTCDATISDGLFEKNTAQNGGGLFAYTSTLNVTGGEFNENSAVFSGGALCVGYGNMTLSGGSFTGNIATNSNGGAIYISYCNATVSDGWFEDNAGKYGGGFFMDDSTVDFTGGTFLGNKSNQGAGLFIRDSSVVIGNITVSDNECVVDDGRYTADAYNAVYGGGILIDSLGGSCSVTINTGTISDNFAPYGGGLWVKNISNKGDRGVSLTINGGEITNNIAKFDGGGIYVHGANYATEEIFSSLTLNGGTISGNTASGNGGGVWAGNMAKVYINGTEEIRGVVTANTANNGGGVYVTSGAHLTVHNGFIIKNNAVAPANASGLTTAKGNDANLYGTGGGICVTAGASEDRLSAFTLTGDDMAIYGNTATFAADDVFASGNNTKLNVPTVADMNLAGYDFKPEGWFEDYNTGDSAYQEGMNMIAANGGSNIKILRYRNTSAVERHYMHILPAYVSDDGVNRVNAYVAMTLGIPGAMDDSVVVDFGKNAAINVWQNDQFMDTEDFADTTDAAGDTVYHSYIGYEIPEIAQYKDGVLYSAAKPDTGAEFGIYDDVLVDGMNGIVTNGKNGIINYQLTTMSVDKLDTFFYMVQHNDVWYYANITVIPATSIYFEDNAAAIKYHTQADSQFDLLANWEIVGESSTVSQDQDCPGASTLKGLDADNIYGFDGSYTNSVTYSNGAIHKVTVTRQDASTTTNARATFVFTGTGFDIISLSSQATGLVTVSVYEGTENIVFEDDPSTPEWEATDPYKTWLVDTYYDAGDTLYQVPVIKTSGLPYGTYTVELYIAPSFIPREHAYYTADFYLDAIRIYDPMGVGGEKDQVAQDTYLADGENWPIYAEIRNMFINQGDLESETALEGILFIDGQDQPTLDNYRSWGPNNEIYLNPGQSVAFMLDGANYGEHVAAVHVGLRGLTGEGHVLVQTKAETDEHKSTVLETALGVTDLYYDITGAMNKVITITNDGEAPISISTVKVTHTEAPSSNYSLRKMFTVDVETGNIALEILTPEVLADPVLTPKYPALSFDGMVCYNVFFSAEDLGDLNGADLGLAVFDSYDPEGTVANAKDVILGATQIDGLYMVATNGIHAKYLGDTQYFRAFAKKADGTYIYSKMVSYSALDYAKNVLAKSNDVKLKQLVVAMLNYGAEAQKFFGYNTENLMNMDLTADQQALVSGFSAGSLNTVGKVDASKVGSFASTGGFAKKYPAISFKGAFEINYFMVPSYVVDNDMTLYIWNEDTYNSATQLTADNADKVVTMTVENGLYTASSDEIIAKNLDKTVYVAAVYESNGVSYCSGVLPYSIAAYCQKPGADVAALANAAAVYGCAAKEYFGV